MNATRRDFLTKAATFSGAGALSLLNDSIVRAAAIQPVSGTSVLDAEHIVVLMQENRSFDHTFGALRGVRGFNDPRAISLADGNPVWAQPDGKGNRYLPFRLNLMDTQATWMGALPHSWGDQVDARNNGQYDRWLIAKKPGNKAYADMPLTLGYYTRDDIPFYYSLADAFTVCDQYFCSCLTGTTPNRLKMWTGTIRAEQDSRSKANVLNQDVDYGRWASWLTFPERLEDLGVSWKVYQNELSLESGLDSEHDAWLANFTDNPLEWFEQFGVRYAATHRQFIIQRLLEIPELIRLKKVEAQSAADTQRARLLQEIAGLERAWQRYQGEKDLFTAADYDSLSVRAKRMHERAFTINSQDPNFRELTDFEYVDDAGKKRQLRVPAGDVLFQFREDVESGNLPTISWLVPPERFSDHPGSAWYGAWYLSETLDILTKNPEVWKKTVFLLTYDENDGYFDHVPPFVAPNPAAPETGTVSRSIDSSLEYVSLEQDRLWHPFQARGSSIGLGYRVPMVIASPWSRGGAVCSQVFDHTSIIQLMEKVLSRKTGNRVEETNINSWRRSVCGDLTSAFRSADETPAALVPLSHDVFIAKIHQAQFKSLPSGYQALSDDQLTVLRRAPRQSDLFPQQELGSRPSCPLPYELSVTAALDPARDRVVIRLEADNQLFQGQAAGSAFTAYAFMAENQFSCRNYAVAVTEAVEDSWRLADFDQGLYHIRVYGPNGYFWSLRGNARDPLLSVQLAPAKLGVDEANAEVLISSKESHSVTVSLVDHSYGNPMQTKEIAAGERTSLGVSTVNTARWYDLGVSIQGNPHYERRFAGRLENGQWSQSDPLIGAF